MSPGFGRLIGIDRMGNHGGRAQFEVTMLLLLLMILGSPAFGENATGWTFKFRNLRLTSRMLRIKKHLHTINKQPVKTIRSPDGDFIDCVQMSKQPAFDHPILQNHQLQEVPDLWPGKAEQSAETEEDDDRTGIAQLWHRTGKRCPSGTIPIRRTTIDDMLRSRSVKKYGRKFHMPANIQMRTNATRTATTFTSSLNQEEESAQPSPSPSSSSLLPQAVDSTSHEHAIAYTTGEYYGAQASLNVWRPGIGAPGEFSLSQIWLLGGPFGSDLNSIEAGWQVSVQLYGDGNPRFFTYWTSDAYQATGCYNLLCSGFIQTSSNVAIGAAISPVSTIDGPQYDLRILIWKDPRTGNWWLRLGDRSLVGYWPAEIFSHLTDCASMIQWGGEVVNTEPDGSHTATQMGSGRFPSAGFAEASYFRNLGVVDSNNELQQRLFLQTLAEYPQCYGIQKASNTDWGDYFYFGGPGNNPKCH